MSSDQIQPHDQSLSRATSKSRMWGRSWVKRDLEFWHRCTIEADHGDQVTISLDSMEEFTVDRDCVHAFELEPGDLVFTERWRGCISGHPAHVVSVKGEVVIVEYPKVVFGESTRETFFLRDIRFYADLTPRPWKKGTAVFAYKAVQFHPPLFLMFPARVEQLHFNDHVVAVEFVDGERTVAPATLVEQRDLAPGELVHTCTDYQVNEVGAKEGWGPCHVVRRDGDMLLLRDEAGAQFEAHASMIAVLPKGYQMFDGKFEKGNGIRPRLPEAAGLPPSDTVRILRTDHWRNAEDDPIAKSELDRLIAADVELGWAIPSLDDGDRAAAVLLWNGKPAFRHQCGAILCTRPDERQLAKMIEIAVALDANVIGDDGKDYH